MLTDPSNDLVAAVYQIICERVPNQGVRFLQHFGATCQEVRSQHGDKIALNHYWRLELGLLRSNTVPERECLTTDSSDEIWLMNFRTYILPKIIKEDLPRLV